MKKGDGWYENKFGILYVQGSVNGKFERKSTKLKATSKNITYIKKHSKDILMELCQKESESQRFTLQEFGEKVIKGWEDKKLPSSHKNTIAQFNRHIVPYFKDTPIDSIKALDIEIWETNLLAKLKSGTVKNIHYILSSIFRKAVANDIISKNPCEYADKFIVSHEKKESYSIEEVKTILEGTQGLLSLYLNIAFSTGMRTGEILALKWSDIDFEKSCIHLKRNISKGVITEVEKDFKIITSRDGSIKKLPRGKETKNHDRTVYLIPKILDMLSLSSKESSSEWLFTPMGKKTPYQDSQTLSEGYFRPALQKLGVPYKGFYNTRHTFLTITDEMNLNPKFINLMAGHKEDSKVGEKHYINRQVTEASAKSALNQLEPFQRLIYGE